jgi:hypothetical protein
MKDKKGDIERRKNKRYKTDEGAYAAIGPDSHTLGRIINISMGGICFQYVGTIKDDQNVMTQQDNLISLSSSNKFVEDLSYKTIDDYEVTNTPSFSYMESRRQHVQFRNLNRKQFSNLGDYLKNNVSEHE